MIATPLTTLAPAQSPRPRQFQPVFDQAGITLYQADVLEGLRQLKSKSIGTIVKSQPYFQMADYEVEGQIGREPTLDEYLAFQIEVAKEEYRVLADNCCMISILGDTSNNYSPVYGKGKNRSGNWDDRRPIQFGIVAGTRKKLLESADLQVPWRYYLAVMEEAGFTPLCYLMWRKPGKGNRKTKFCHFDCEPVLVFLKQTRGRRANPAYFKMFDSMILEHQVVSDDVHRCPYPPSLVQELLEHTHPAKLGLPVLDPYVGSGTTAYVAYQMGFPAIGIDLDCARAMEQCEAAIAGTLKGFKRLKSAKKSVGICPQQKPRNNPTTEKRRLRTVSGWTEPVHRETKAGKHTDWNYRWLLSGRRRPCIKLKSKEVKDEVERMISAGKTVAEIRSYLGDTGD